MNDQLRGLIAVVSIAFFIIVAIVVNTPALMGTLLIQFPDQEEIIIENETASSNRTAMNNNSSNNTE